MSVVSHPAFRFIRRVPIAALNTTVEEYRHNVTGALHYHLQADNPENVFLVALRTVPMDNKGVAHILEHTALCGSKRYPVRDPFFMMIRRSLNTFMNAFTSNDWTAYPFASQNRKDFNNLLDVYLDAVFFSRLDELDFMQEGHRLDFAVPGNKDSDLVYKGVVFNEMKGAMSSVSSVLWQSLCKHLFPSTTYHYNSGGDPEYITDLSYQELREFYQRHYHPSNAIFMTYGDIPAIEHQAVLEEKALAHFERGDTNISIGREKRYHAPIRVEEAYAFDSEDSTDEQTHIVIAWLLGQNTDLNDVLAAQLISYILLENSACPLQYYLETTDLGSAPSPLCGLEDSYRELVFSCGISGSDAIHADQFEKDVLAIIEKTANDGIDEQRLNAILHQIELSHREVSGDGYPYGLQLILTALSSATHRGDPVELLDLEPALANLRQAAQDKDFVGNLLRRWLLDNQHRVRLVMTPDKELSKRRQAAEAAQLAAIKASLSDEEKQAIIDKARALEERQARIDDDAILPKVTLLDVPADLSIPVGSKTEFNQFDSHYYAQGTNGLVYQQLIIPLPALPDSLLAHLPFYAQMLTEVGLGEKSFTEVQHLQSEVVGNISAFTSIRGDVNNAQDLTAYLVISAKSLVRQHEAMADLLKTTLIDARFDELERLRDMISQTRSRREQSLTGNGHSLAMTAASAGLSPLAALSEQWSGLSGIKTLKALDKSLNDAAQLKALADALTAIHAAVKTMPVSLLTVAEKEHQKSIEAYLEKLWQSQNPVSFGFAAEPTRTTRRVAWLANTQVNFCAKAYPTVPTGHPDSAALVVLGGYLRNGFLHTAIREKGGAYGGGAGQDNNIAAFRFYSYRDPRITGTLSDFDAAIDWMLNHNHQASQLEEAILGVIGSLDKPGSPAGEAKQAFHNSLFGRTAEQRRAYRQQILAVTIEDLKRVTKTYLVPEKASIAVLTHEGNLKELEQLGLEILTL